MGTSQPGDDVFKETIKGRKGRMLLAAIFLTCAAIGVVHHFRQSQAIQVTLEVSLLELEVVVPETTPPLQLGHYELEEIAIRVVSDGDVKAETSFPFSDPTQKPAKVRAHMTLTRGTYTAQTTLIFRLPDGRVHEAQREETLEIDDDGVLTLSL